MHTLKSLLQFIAAVAVAGGASIGLANAAQRAAPGECGEYMYYQHGQCVDARQKPGKEWTKGVMG